MSINPERFTRKTFEIEAVRVTKGNFLEVANWCEGVLRPDEGNGPFFKVDVKRPVSERQTRAYVGDWVLRAGTGFKVYTNNAFREFFIPVRQGVQIINTPRTKPDVFPGEPKEMTEELPFNVVDHTKPKPCPTRPLKVIKPAQAIGLPTGFAPKQ